MGIKTVTIIGRNSLSQAVQQVLTAGHFKVITSEVVSRLVRLFFLRGSSSTSWKSAALSPF